MAAAVLAISGGGAALGNVADLGFDIAASAADFENDDYTYSYDAGGVAIEDYIGDSNNVVIPSEIDGVNVVKICGSAFHHKDIESVVIPKTVKEIESGGWGTGAFSHCENLSSVTLNEGLVNIGSYAFNDCPKLKSIRIPKSVKIVDYQVVGFVDGAVMKDFKLYCYRNSAAQIYAKDNKVNYELMISHDGHDYDYNITDGGIEITDYVGDDTSVIIPSKIEGKPVVKICDKAFYHKDIESVVIPDTVKEIESGGWGVGTFSNCEKLSSVTLNEGLVTIGSYAFNDCPKLKSIQIPKSVKVVDYQFYGFLNGGAMTSGFTIYCYRNSAAQAYAKDNGISYEIITNPTPINPTVTADNIKDTSFDINWNAVSGAQKYAVCGYIDNNWKKLAETTATAYTFTALTPDTDYRVTVFAMFNNEWYTDSSKAITVTTKPEEILPTYPIVSNLNINSKYHQARIDWEPCKDAEKYAIALLVGGKWKIQGYVNADSTTFVTPKLKANTLYTLAICAKVNGEWDTSKINERTFKIYMI